MEWALQSSLEQYPRAGGSSGTSGEGSDEKPEEESDGYEYQPPQIMGFSSKSVLNGSRHSD
ncbi:hypothetical protein P692DRAFT_20825948 [Suillus brevipes Sb2]|nr:hypothetical protein P692DRAFT_20825948 [Suillus brevipes Sb2]